MFCLSLRWVGHEKSLRHTKGRRSLPTCKRHDETCGCCRCCGSSGTIKIRDGRNGSSNEVLLPVMETDLAGVTRMLGLAIADNFASGNLPPFKLVEVVESLGLGPVHPDHASPMEIITGLLADLPPEQTNPTAVARAHANIMVSEFKDQWFEAGEAVEDLLYPVKGFNQRVAKLTKAYLPERRLFWARLCAISALALRGNEKTRHSPWKQLALVGRDIASDLPLGQIPLMKQVAETSVRAFESRL